MALRTVLHSLSGASCVCDVLSHNTNVHFYLLCSLTHPQTDSLTHALTRSRGQLVFELPRVGDTALACVVVADSGEPRVSAPLAIALLGEYESIGKEKNKSKAWMGVTFSMTWEGVVGASCSSALNTSRWPVLL